MDPQVSQWQLGAEGECGMSSLLVPSPQSEAVTHEMEELSLQPTQSLPPLSERKNVLQLRLQQRRTREQLVDQGIMPPLKSPAAFHGQIRSLERARTENFLKHKIRSRPERAELVRMHILQETGAEPSLQATQMKLKRARLADNLNEKIAQRPGPMELVEKNILPVDSSLKQAIIVGQVNYPKVLDEDSCDALSPEQPASQESQSSVPSPGESKAPETPSPVPVPAPAPLSSPMLQAFPVATQAGQDFVKVISTNELPACRPAVIPAPSKPGPTLVKQSQQKTPSEKSRSKKGKEPKPRVKKLKYHQYVPPDQKQEASEAPMDSSYARLLQQQQLFLQLQILSQQQQHYNYQTILPAPLKSVAEGQGSTASSLPTSIVVSLPTAPPPPPLPPAPARLNNSLSNRKPGVLPANLEEMKVAELKLELKLRSLPVSGTKTDLIERLKPFQDNPTTSAPVTIPLATTTSIPMEVTTTTTTTPAALVLPVQQVTPESMSSTPPVSPIPNDPCTLQQDGGMSEAPEVQMVSSGSAGPRSSPLSPFQVPEEKDRRLHEKERQIEELMRKLEHEQRLVEELKMQLEVEKRGQGCTADSLSVSPKLTSIPAMNPVPTVLNSNVVKMEGAVLSNCSSTAATIPNSVLGSRALTSPLPTVVKLEDVTVSAGKPIQLQTQTQLLTQIQPQAQPQVTTSPQLLPQSQRSPKLQTQAQSQPAAPSLQQFFISHSGGVSQVLGQPQTLLTTTGQAGTQILLPVSLPNSATAIQLPSTAVSLQPVLQATVSNPGLSVPQLQSTKMETAPSQQLANHNPLLQTLTLCNNTTGLENHTRPEMNRQCFLRSSPETRVSPQASPNHHMSNGPLNKSPSPQPTFILQPTSLITQPPKTREPPRYEDAVKQSRNMHINNVSQVPTATSQQMDDLFDILIESGEITPFIQQDPPVSLNKTHPVTANITTLPVNTALCRPPPQIHLAPPPTLSPVIDPSLSSLSSLATDNQLEAFLEGTLAGTSPVSDPRTQGLMEELQAQLMDQQPYSPMDTSDLSFCDSSSPPSSLNMGLSDPALDNMEWLDLTMPPGPAGALTPLGIPTDFLDTHDLQLHWD
ncbi:MKL/myocardin-like protein 2 [Seriola lalandi dorsalis]|uniref:MKL/myocardin-like protein 2 n=1 Tax=Seriola lalandi dorsalis TaxID=1841481 RepID=UPI000C6F457C|nr:MKL/myocardin-like protein 2 [Seriola lalandi dorsalis]XP_056222916.1 myocardin-related transcription factor B isoform X2 [Seriola aureovittata]